MNNRTFGGLERDPGDVWSLVRFNVSLRMLVTTFCKYSFGLILLAWSPFLQVKLFCGLDFFICPFILKKAWFFMGKKKCKNKECTYWLIYLISHLKPHLMTRCHSKKLSLGMESYGCNGTICIGGEQCWAITHIRLYKKVGEGNYRNHESQCILPCLHPRVEHHNPNFH